MDSFLRKHGNTLQYAFYKDIFSGVKQDSKDLFNFEEENLTAGRLPFIMLRSFTPVASCLLL